MLSSLITAAALPKRLHYLKQASSECILSDNVVGQIRQSNCTSPLCSKDPLPQLIQTRSELDALEEILASPTVARNMERWTPFFAAVPRLLSPETSAADFRAQLVETLFPDTPYLNLAECMWS